MWPPLANGCLLRGTCNTQSFLAELRRAWPPLARGCLLRGSCSTQSFLGPPLARGCLLQGRCSTKSLLRRLTHSLTLSSLHHLSHRTHHSLHHLSHLTHHSPLFTTPLITSQSHPSFTTLHYTTYIYLSPLTHHSPLFTTLLITSHSSFTTLQYTTYHISLIIHHSSLHSSHLTHHSPLFTTPLIAWQAGAVQRASWLPFAWQVQYTEPPGGAAARVAAAGPRLLHVSCVGLLFFTWIPPLLFPSPPS